MDLFHKHLGDHLPNLRGLSDARRKVLRARLYDLGGLQQFGRFCEYVAQSDFLMGRKSDFKASFDWLLKPSNFAKVIEGNYENNRAANGRGQLQQELENLR